jgi:hypothetical protein
VLLLTGLFLLTAPFLKAWWVTAGENRSKAFEPAMVALVAVTVPFLVSQVKPLFAARFTIVALPALCLAIAAFAPTIKKHFFETALVGAAIAFAIPVSMYASRCDSRTAAQYLARTAQTGDVVVFTNLSRLPIDYYWDRIQPDRQVREQSFPAEIVTHPGFVGIPRTGAPAGKLGEEAELMVAQFSKRRASRVFLLHGYRPAEDAPLRSRLDAQFSPITSLNMDCGSMGSYFDQLSAYSCLDDETPLAFNAAR